MLSSEEINKATFDHYPTLYTQTMDPSVSAMNVYCYTTSHMNAHISLITIHTAGCYRIISACCEAGLLHDDDDDCLFESPIKHILSLLDRKGERGKKAGKTNCYIF